MKSLYVSVFGNVKNAVIENLTLANVSVEVSTTFDQTDRIYVSAICSFMEKSVIRNVNVKNFDMTIAKTPWDDDEEKKKDNLVVAADGIYVEKDETSAVENSSVEYAGKE